MKTAYDMKHVKGTTAIALLKDGQSAGKIVANWSDNPNGSVCTATVLVYRAEDDSWYRGTARTGGYGYDKLSSAVYWALDGATCNEWTGNGSETYEAHLDLTEYIKVKPASGNTRHAFEEAGYQYIEVC